MRRSWRAVPPQPGAATEDDVNVRLARAARVEGARRVTSESGRFYLVTKRGRMEVPLVAEGLRKLGMLARLVATGALLDKGCLHWDEPEANLNPRIIKTVARSIVELSLGGIQVFIATHSLFLLREIEMILAAAPQNVDVRFFGLHPTDDGVSVQQGPKPEDMGEIAVLKEELEQSDRFLETGA